MSKRVDLLESIADTIKDYRKGAIPKPTAEHVDRWVRQFSEGVQMPLLAEMDHVLDKTYFSKQIVTDFFEHQIEHKKIAGENPCAFWKGANLLDIQKQGHSQTEILALFSESLKRKCQISVSDCGSKDGAFIYLDDVMFSGSRIGNDLTTWIQKVAPTEATVHILVIGTHRLGEWQCITNLAKIAKDAGKKITFTCWAAIRLENRRKYKNTSEVLWPAEIPNNSSLANYMAQETKFPFEPRTPGGKPENEIFSGEEGRQLLERELMLAGIRILDKCQSPKRSVRPLGFGYFGLGFGATIVTFRNCPNNCPLALWWGDPQATSGPFHWYPLLPRKTYSQSFDFSDLVF